MTDRSERLAEKLEGLSELAIDELRRVLELGELDEECIALVRAKVAAAGVALGVQVKVDALRMRAIRADAALDRLLVILAEKEGEVPCAVEHGRTRAICVRGE